METQDTSQGSLARRPVPLAVLSRSPSRLARRPVSLAVPPSRPSRTLAGVARLAPTARRCARKNRSATTIRAGAPSRTVFVAIPAPVCHRGPSSASSKRQGCPRRPLLAAASRRGAIANRFRGHPHASMPSRTVFGLIPAPLCLQKPSFAPYFCRYPTCNQALMKILGARRQGAGHRSQETGVRSQKTPTRNLKPNATRQASPIPHSPLAIPNS